MRAGALDPIHGRCPTCGQVVILSLEVRARLVECPRCGHRGSGAMFVDIEAPLPVVLVPSAPERSGSDAPHPDAAGLDPEAGPLDDIRADEALSDEVLSDEALSDEARSDDMRADEGPPEEVPSDGDLAEAEVADAYDAALSSVRAAQPAQGEASGRDERTLLLGDERTLLLGDERTLLMGDGPTRLVLDSPFLKREPSSERPRSSRSDRSNRSGAKSSPVPKARAGDEERTHLLLDPLDLKDERETPFSRMSTRLRPLGARTLALAEALHDGLRGRWPAVLAILGVAGGLLPPLFDYLTDDPGSTAARVASVATLIALAAFVLAWVATLRQDDGVWNGSVASVRLQAALRRLVDDVREFGRSPPHLKLWFCAVTFATLGLAAAGLAAVRGVVRLLLGASDQPSLLRVLGGLALIIGTLLLRAAQRAAPRGAPGPEELAESLEAAHGLPPVVDLSEPLPPAFARADSPFHRLVFALSEWRDHPWPDEAGYRAALERYLQRHLPNAPVERERPLGRSRHEGVADLVLYDLVLIEVKHGFRQRSAERAIARLREHAQRWKGKPMLLVIFDASREIVFEGGATAALADLHARLGVVTVRMPTRS
jgi:hypothetical protein